MKSEEAMAEGSVSAEKQTLTFTVSGLAFRGHGIARTSDGQVVFLPYAVPGDVVRARIVESRGDYLRGAIEQIEKPGADRMSPPCRHFGRCGGCQWLHLKDEAQLYWKA